MAKGISLHLGLNAVDPRHYEGWSGELNACEEDARDMQAIATFRHFDKTTKLLTKDATRKNLEENLKKITAELTTGDLFLLTYSGHGGQIPDRNEDEADGLDETWCLYDGEWIDDETYAALGKIPTGAHVIILSDSCHSGTVIKEAYHRDRLTQAAAGTTARFRCMPSEAMLRTYRAHKEFYDTLQQKKDKDARLKIKANCVLISGCQDNQLSQDGNYNGLFTGTLLRVWANGRYEQGLRSFHRAIVRRMPPDQTPNFYRIGPADMEYETRPPFTIPR